MKKTAGRRLPLDNLKIIASCTFIHKKINRGDSDRTAIGEEEESTFLFS